MVLFFFNHGSASCLHRFLYAYTISSVTHTAPAPQQQYSYPTYENPPHLRHTSYGTPVQPCIYKLTIAFKPTLARPSVRNSHYGIGARRCGGCEPSSGIVDELWLAARIYSYRCCCALVFYPAQLESQHDVLYSPSTLGIWVPSPLAWGRKS